jgi:hypothetical protein
MLVGIFRLLFLLKPHFTFLSEGDFQAGKILYMEFHGLFCVVFGGLKA